jgi:hypothetical protein
LLRHESAKATPDCYLVRDEPMIEDNAAVIEAAFALDLESDRVQ